MTFDEAVERVKSLPQAQHITEARIRGFCQKITKLDKDPSFYIDRLMGVGGSEIGAILYHYYGSTLAKNLSSSFFKNAPAIAKEKLLLSLPYSTVASQRGNKVEPFIRALLEMKFPSFRRREDLMRLAGQHKTCKYALGNTDDVFQNEINNQIILFDYKSSLATEQELEGFSNIAQLNHYNEIMRSHNLNVDGAFTVKLKAANEEIFKDVIAAFENRNEEPEAYKFWCNSIIKEKLSSVKLDITPITLSPQFGRLCVQASERFMNEFVNVGKLLTDTIEKTLIIEEEVKEATHLEGLIYHVQSADKAISIIKERIDSRMQDFRDRVGQPFDWPEKFPVKIKEKIVINEKAALEALELAQFDTSSLFVQSDKAEIDAEKLLAKFIKIGGEVDNSLYTTKLSTEKLIAALQQCDLNVNDFKEASKITSTLSRSMSDSDQNFSDKSDWAEAIYKIVNTNTFHDISNFEDDAGQFNSGMGMN